MLFSPPFLKYICITFNNQIFNRGDTHNNFWPHKNEKRTRVSWTNFTFPIPLLHSDLQAVSCTSTYPLIPSLKQDLKPISPTIKAAHSSSYQTRPLPPSPTPPPCPGTWHKHMLATLMPQTRASGHAYTAPYYLTEQPHCKKLPLPSSTAYPIWLSPPFPWILSWKCRFIHSTFFWRTAENHTAEQLENDTISWSKTSVKREPPARCIAHSWNQSL